VKICVIGAGRMGYLHARLLNKLGYLDAIVDTNALIAEKVGKQFKTSWYSDLETMIEERVPNGIIVAVPTKDHCKVVQQVVKQVPNLKALLIEKPVTPSVKEAEDLKNKLAKFEIPVIIGHIEVYNPVISKTINILNQGYIGELHSLFFQRRGAVGEERIQTLGDVYEDIGVHDFDVASRMLPRCEIKLFGSSVKENGIDNSSVIVISSKEKDFFCTFLMSREYAGKARTIDIEGTKATLHANLITQILELRSLEVARGEKDFSAIRVPFSNGEQIKIYGEPLLQELWNLVDCIKGSASPLVTIDDGINALKLVEAARQSIYTDESVYTRLLGS
jgi:UDP-N-acetylglucosamine 3-dehydrogenase